MKTKEELERELVQLRRGYKSAESILAMMEKETKREDLLKMRKEQLDPIREKIRDLEEELVRAAN